MKTDTIRILDITATIEKTGISHDRVLPNERCFFETTDKGRVTFDITEWLVISYAKSVAGLYTSVAFKVRGEVYAPNTIIGVAPFELQNTIYGLSSENKLIEVKVSNLEFVWLDNQEIKHINVSNKLKY